jgi:hypothetical protein
MAACGGEIIDGSGDASTDGEGDAIATPDGRGHDSGAEDSALRDGTARDSSRDAPVDHSSFDTGRDSAHDSGRDASPDAACVPPCDPELGLTCVAGACTGACAGLASSYIGCEYYAASMANDQLDQTTFGFYVVVVNQGTSSATLTITGGGLTSADTVVVPAGSVQNVGLPWVTALSKSQATTIATGGAYHLKSTLPISAYQFNSFDYQLGGTQSYTNDASLLLPVSTLTANYYVAAWPSWYDGANFAGTIAIVGTAPSTTVTVTPPATAFQAGAGLTASGGTVTLNAGDVLQIGTALDATSGKYGTDPSGTRVTASAPVEVFGGSDCSAIPSGVLACDHLEEVQIPLEELGMDYLVTLPDNTNGSPQEVVKIVGTVDGTTLTYDPPTGYVTAPATSLDAGGVTSFRTLQSFHVMATSPIVVAQYMESGGKFMTSDTAGDPSMSMAVPTTQFLDSYGFVAPPNWIQTWVNVIAPTGASVTVTDFPSNQTVSSGTAIGGSGYYLAWVEVCDGGLTGCTGYHTASSSSPFGLQVYSYGSYTSLMYSAGLSLTP